MTSSQGARAYQHTQVTTTVSQKQLILMAYDGVLKFLRQAKEGMTRGDIELKYDSLCRARAILEELASTLNMEAGGEVAQNLWNLYMFFLQRIGEANLTHDMSYIDGIVPAITDLRDAWEEMELPTDDSKAQALDRRVPDAQDAHRVSITG